MDLNRLIAARSAARRERPPFLAFVLILGGAVLMPPLAVGADAHPPHWSYEGEEGPAHWGELALGNRNCSKGTAQSPIDISNPQRQGIANPIFHYKPSKLNIIDNGHTIQVDYDPGSFMELDGVQYELVQFHFHVPSEHSINGKLADAELHLVHRNAAGKLAVVGVLIRSGTDNAALAALMAHLPAKKGPVRHINATVDAATLLPAATNVYRYDGSLTTPPCTEGVKWNVMVQPIALSEKQLNSFVSVLHANNRPVQPINGRSIVEDLTP
jgi:carbonic anhydrase